MLFLFQMITKFFLFPQKTAFKEATVCLFVFDCIYYNGEDLTDKYAKFGINCLFKYDFCLRIDFVTFQAPERKTEDLGESYGRNSEPCTLL